MKVKVNIPCKPSRIYEDDFIEETIPNVGEKFDDEYIVAKKEINEDFCTLDLKKKKR